MNEQFNICKKYNSHIVNCHPFRKIGIAVETMKNEPIRGRRYLPQGDTEGWYIWGGEFSEAEDFFQPIHIEHVQTLFPMIWNYLSLAPGFSFIIDKDGYEDVWFSQDQSTKHHE